MRVGLTVVIYRWGEGVEELEDIKFMDYGRAAGCWWC